MQAALVRCHVLHHNASIVSMHVCSVDVNVSVRPMGSPTLGTKVEVKNMNSFSNMQKAIDFEINRQVGAAAYMQVCTCAGC